MFFLARYLGFLLQNQKNIIACLLKLKFLPKPKFDLHEKPFMHLVLALSFVKFFDPY
jgi:hypothetical protein